MQPKFEVVSYTNKERIIAEVIYKVYMELQKGHKWTSEVKSPVSDKYFAYIMTHGKEFNVILQIVYSYLLFNGKGKLKLLDVGCGDGLTSMMVERFISCLSMGKELTSTGIDVNIPCEYNFVQIEKQNALTYSLYHEFDILYCYHPIIDEKIMTRLIDTMDRFSNARSLSIFNNPGIWPSIHYELVRRGFKRCEWNANMYYKIKEI